MDIAANRHAPTAQTRSVQLSARSLRLLSAATMPIIWAAPTITGLCTASWLCTGIAFLLATVTWYRLRSLNWSSIDHERAAAWQAGHAAGKREAIEQQIGRIESALMQSPAHQARSVGE